MSMLYIAYLGIENSESIAKSIGKRANEYDIEVKVRTFRPLSSKTTPQIIRTPGIYFDYYTVVASSKEELDDIIMNIIEYENNVVMGTEPEFQRIEVE